MSVVERLMEENADLRRRLHAAEGISEDRLDALQVTAKDAIRYQDAAKLAERARKDLEAMIARKNAALARPCINCGYEPKLVQPAGAPEGTQ